MIIRSWQRMLVFLLHVIKNTKSQSFTMQKAIRNPMAFEFFQPDFKDGSDSMTKMLPNFLKDVINIREHFYLL